jgi:hypothetical protein
VIRRRRLQVGVAIGREGMVAVADGTTEPIATVRMQADRCTHRDVAEAFISLAGALPCANVDLHVVLMPPLATVRRVSLPPLRHRVLATVLRRYARQYVPLSGAVTAGASNGRGMRAAPNPLIAAASEELVVSIHDATLPAGVRTASVRDACGAWIAAARQDTPATHDAVAVVHVAGQTLVLTGRADAVDTIRRAPGTPSLEALLPQPAEGPFVDETRTCVVLGLQPAPVHGWVFQEQRVPADVVAASWAARSASPLLVPEAVRVAQLVRTRRAARRMARAAACVLVLAGAVETAGLHFRLAALRSDRTEIRATVTPVLAIRDSLDALRTRLATLASMDDGTVRWTDVLFELAMLLPRDAYVTQLAGDADSLLVAGTAVRAAHAVEALRNGSTITMPQFSGAIRRELREGEDPLEHFTLVARLPRHADDSSPPGRPATVGTPQ